MRLRSVSFISVGSVVGWLNGFGRSPVGGITLFLKLPLGDDDRTFGVSFINFEPLSNSDAVEAAGSITVKICFCARFICIKISSMVHLYILG